jgi:putative transposase
VAERKHMVSKKNKLSIVKQCRLLKVNRSSVYHRAAPPSDDDLKLMRLIDQIHLSRPYLGVRRITDSLRDSGEATNHKRVYRLMKQMGIQAIYPKPNTSKKHPKNKIYPYLLRGLTINRPNHVWATDITYVPMSSGFVYLTVIMDWYSRKVLSWRLSNSMDSQFCVDALEEAIHHYGKPAIFNSDQGSQFTSDIFTQVLKQNDIKISMDGKAAWRDNVFVERLWRSIKYEEIYLNAYDSVTEAKAGIKAWLNFYNEERKHQTLGTTPSLMYDNLSGQLAA